MKVASSGVPPDAAVARVLPGRLLEPLEKPLFRALWIASMVSNIGTQMQQAGAAWQMTFLSASPLLLGLVSLMTYAPTLLFSPVAGVVTDLSDRRRLLLTTQAMLWVLAMALALVTYFGALTPFMLLTLVGAMGLVTVFNGNCWHTVVQEIVPREQLSQAVSLNAISINSARSIGPALGGVFIAWLGTEAVFFLNAFSFMGTIVVVYRWRGEHLPPRPEKREAMLGAMKEGARYVVHRPLLVWLLFRHLCAIAGGFSVMTLLPLLARGRLHLEAEGYGFLSAAYGVGAVVAAVSAHAISSRWGLRVTTRVALCLLVGTLFGLVFATHARVVAGLLFFNGLCLTFTAINHGVRVRMSIAPSMVGRVFAYYAMMGLGGMALSGLIFGSLAAWAGVPSAILGATALVLVALWVALRHPMPQVYRPEAEVATGQ